MSPPVEVVDRPTLAELAKSGLGWTDERIPVDDVTLKSAVVAEAIRTGLYALYHQESPPEPVHQLALRGWIKHKLGALVPDLFDAAETSYRQVLLEGRGANLEFLGDALVLSDGYLCPAPTRLVDVGGGSHLLISGTPTHFLPKISERVVHATLGRRLDGLTASEIEHLGFPTQSMDEYLGKPGGLPPPQELVAGVLGLAGQPWSESPEWEVYSGNPEAREGRPDGKYGFTWTPEDSPSAKRALSHDFEGRKLSIWCLPLPTSDRFHAHYLRVDSGGKRSLYPIDALGWKQTCLALDFLAGQPRQALMARDGQRPGASLMLGFPPFESLARALHAFGARMLGRRHALDSWEIPIVSVARIKAILEKVGVKVKTMGLGE